MECCSVSVVTPIFFGNTASMHCQRRSRRRIVEAVYLSFCGASIKKLSRRVILLRCWVTIAEAVGTTCIMPVAVEVEEEEEEEEEGPGIGAETAATEETETEEEEVVAVLGLAAGALGGVIEISETATVATEVRIAAIIRISSNTAMVRLGIEMSIPTVVIITRTATSTVAVGKRTEIEREMGVMTGIPIVTEEEQDRAQEAEVATVFTVETGDPTVMAVAVMEEEEVEEAAKSVIIIATTTVMGVAETVEDIAVTTTTITPSNSSSSNEEEEEEEEKEAILLQAKVLAGA